MHLRAKSNAARIGIVAAWACVLSGVPAAPAGAVPGGGVPWRAAPLGLAAVASPGVDAARALRGGRVVAVSSQPDSTMLVEIRTSDGRPVRIVLNRAEWGAVSRQLDKPGMAGRRPGSSDGRGGLVLYQTALGLGYYGWAVPKILSIDDTKGQIGAYMVTAAASFAVPYLLTRHVDVSDADRRMSGYGSTRGLALGLQVNNAIGRDRLYDDYSDPDKFYDDREADRRRLHELAVLGSVAGSFAGYYASGALGDDPARTELVGVGGDYGAALAAAASYTFGWYEGSERWRRMDRGVLNTAGFAAGLAAGTALASRVPATTGDTYVLRDALALGTQLGLPLGYWLSPRREARATVRGGMLGSLAGGVYGLSLIRRDDYSESEGLLLTAAQAASGLFALGLVYLVTPGNSSVRTGTALAVSAAGSAGGFTLMRVALQRHHRDRGAR